MSDGQRPPIGAIGALGVLGLVAAAAAVGLLTGAPAGGLVDVRLLGRSVARLSPRDLALGAMALGALAALLIGFGVWVAATSRRRGASDEASIRHAGLEASNLLLERRVKSLEAEIEQLERVRDDLVEETRSLGHRRVPSQGAPRSKMPFPRTSTAGEGEPAGAVDDGEGEQAAGTSAPDVTLPEDVAPGEAPAPEIPAEPR